MAEMSDAVKRTGVIGLGAMGLQMAKHMAAKGFTVTGYDVSADANARAKAFGVAICGSAAEVGASAEVVIVMVATDDQVREVVLASGLLDRLARGAVICVASSASPDLCREIAATAARHGIGVLDTPVVLGQEAADNGTLTIYVGGEDTAFARAKPLFDLMGKNITHVGSENGAGQTCKVANQIIVALNIQACAEALVFAARAGADPAKVRTALMGGFASSRILEVHAERMLNGAFNPGFRIRLHQKDLNLALTAAKELGLSLPNTAIAQQMFSSCAAHGAADLDHSALILAIEGLADFSVRAKE